MAEAQIAFGKKVSKEFKTKVIAISGRLSCDPSHLMAVMAFETGETFSPSKKSLAGSGATGLIQFMPATAKSLGTTTGKLAAMSAVEQLDFVEKFLKPKAGNFNSLSDLYMAVLFPAAV